MVNPRELDMRALDRRALECTDRAVAQVGPADLAKPTPCGAWTVADLLSHLISENNGFASAASGAAPSPALWADGDLGTDPYETYARSAERVRQAFAAQDLYDRRFEVGAFGAVGGRTAVTMHFIDYLTHTWDVAASIGADRALDEELSEIALELMKGFPDKRPNPAFGVHVPVADDAPADHRLLGFLGRSPSWPA